MFYYEEDSCSLLIADTPCNMSFLEHVPANAMYNPIISYINIVVHSTSTKSLVASVNGQSRCILVSIDVETNTIIAAV